MQDRASLHKLVDSLPERVLEQVQSILEYQQNPLDCYVDLNTLQDRIQQHVRRTLEEGRGHISGTGGVGSIWPDGSGEYSVQGFEAAGAHLMLRFRYFRGHKLEIVERLALTSDGRAVQYQQEIIGPLGKTSENNVNFPLS